MSRDLHHRLGAAIGIALRFSQSLVGDRGVMSNENRRPDLVAEMVLVMSRNENTKSLH